MTSRVSPRVTLVLALVAVLGVACAVTLARRRPPAALPKRHLAHPRFALHVDVDHFQRGNVHTHSTRSDGTAPLDATVGWYRDHGYQFLAMTEHGLRLDPSEIDAFDAPGFVVLPGEEVTDAWAGHPLHANALCARATIPDKQTFATADEGIRGMLDAIRAADGVPLLNHPNYEWSLRSGDIVRGASGPFLLEIWSGLPAVNSGGDAQRPSEEAIWNDVLAAGVDAVPAAVDDAHGIPDGPVATDALPGRGWLLTFGAETSVEAICRALRDGRLVASNGPAPARLVVEGDTITVATREPAGFVEFFAEGGQALGRGRALAPAADGARAFAYRLTGDERVVYARLADGAGHRAWTRAYATEEGPP